MQFKKCYYHTSSVLLSVFTMVLLSITLFGCATQEKGNTVSEDAFLMMDQKQAEEDNKAELVPDFVTQALLSNEPETPLAEDYRNSRFDVSVKNIPAKSFFLSLISDVGVNVVAHPNVSGEISLELNNVTVEEVLGVVRDVYGYEYKFKNNIYTVFPSELRTEIFPVNYIDVKRVGISDTSVTVGEINSSSDNQSGGGGSEGSSQSANLLGMAGVEGSSSTSGQGLSPGSRVQTLNNTDFWSVLKLTVSAIVGVKQEGRMVVINPQSGMVVVTALPSELNNVRDFLEKAELSVQRQVILETQILEVRLSEGFEAGIDWGAIQGQLSYSNNLVNKTNLDGIAGTIKEGTKMFSSLFNVLDIRDLLSLLETQGAVQVLSSPRISTVNNQKAIIRVGTDEFFVTGLSTDTTSSAATTTTSPQVDLASFFSGISLDVTPQISTEGDVILHVHPIISEVKDQIKELSVGDANISLPLAIRKVRESDSVVKVGNGQVMVLGGLMQKISSEEDSGQPWLTKVPGVNLFFTQKKSGSVKTELVILMRPIIVEDGTWDSQISEFKKLSGSMGQEYRTR